MPMRYQGFERIWVSGPSGSRWSGVSQRFQRLKNSDNGDCTPQRVMDKPVWLFPDAGKDGKNKRLQVFHKGAYFDPSSEGGQDWMDFPNLTRDQITDEIDRLWGYAQPPGLIRVIKSHQLCMHTHDIKQKFPNDLVILVRREPQAMYDWWVAAGGIHTAYPNYEWYDDEKHVEFFIHVHHQAIEKYVEQVGATWHPFDQQFLWDHFGIDEDPGTDRYGDVTVAVI